MKVRRVGVQTHVRLDLGGAAAVHPPPHASDLARLPEEIVEEILLRVPPDEAAHLVGASLVCKAWHSIISSHAFRRRYGRFHRTPPMQGYFCNNFGDSTVRFAPTTSVIAAAAASHVVCVPKLDGSSVRKPAAMDCRHGRVLIEADDRSGLRQDRRIIVWDPIAGNQQYLSLPTYPKYQFRRKYAGAVLCANDGCDHLDCHGGPFLVVLLGLNYFRLIDDDYDEDVLIASVYSSETGTWSSPTTLNDDTNQCAVDDKTLSLLIGDALYFTASEHGVIIKYDLRKHGLSVIGLPGLFCPKLMKGDDGGLGVATMLHNSIHMWSWRAGINGIDEWVKYRVMDLDTQNPEGGCQGELICAAEGTNTIFICVDKDIFMVDLKSGQVIRKIGQRDYFYHWRILPYMSFFTVKY